MEIHRFTKDGARLPFMFYATTNRFGSPKFVCVNEETGARFSTTSPSERDIVIRKWAKNLPL